MADNTISIDIQATSNLQKMAKGMVASFGQISSGVQKMSSKVVIGFKKMAVVSVKTFRTISSGFKRVAFMSVAATKKMKGFAQSIGSIGSKMGLLVTAAASLSGLVAGRLIKGVTASDKLAQSLGSSSQFLQGLQFAFSKTGISADETLTSVKQFLAAMHGASRKDPVMIRAFRMSGVDITKPENFKPENLEKLYLQTIDGINKRLPKGSSGRRNILGSLFGDPETYVKAIDGGVPDILASIKQAGELGLITSDATNDSIDDIISKFAELKGAVQGLGLQALTASLPTLEKILDFFSTLQDSSELQSFVTSMSESFDKLKDLEEDTKIFTNLATVMTGAFKLLGISIGGLTDLFVIFVNTGTAGFEKLFGHMERFQREFSKEKKVSKFKAVVEFISPVFDPFNIMGPVKEASKAAKKMREDAMGPLDRIMSDDGGSKRRPVSESDLDSELSKNFFKNDMRVELDRLDTSKSKEDNKLDVTIQVKKEDIEVSEVKSSGDLNIFSTVDLGLLA